MIITLSGLLCVLWISWMMQTSQRLTCVVLVVVGLLRMDAPAQAIVQLGMDVLPMCARSAPHSQQNRLVQKTGVDGLGRHAWDSVNSTTPKDSQTHTIPDLVLSLRMASLAILRLVQVRYMPWATRRCTAVGLFKNRCLITANHHADPLSNIADFVTSMRVRMDMPTQVLTIKGSTLQRAVRSSEAKSSLWCPWAQKHIMQRRRRW